MNLVGIKPTTTGLKDVEEECTRFAHVALNLYGHLKISIYII
jgi:hypothetical protein